MRLKGTAALLFAPFFALSLISPANGRASTTIVTASSPEPGLQALFQRWVDESQVPTPNGYATIVFDQGDEGFTHVNPWEPRLIHWWAAGVGADPEGGGGAERLNFYVELGNVFQFTRTTGDNWIMKTHFSKIFRPKHKAKAGIWNWPSLWDWFGMSYASCASGVAIPNSTFWGFEYNPTPRQQRQACNLDRRVG